MQMPMPPASTRPSHDPPPLTAGDHLSRDEFERRYAAMPALHKAELVEGIVHVPSPARVDQHGDPHSMVAGWLAVYAAATPGVQSAIESTVRLDLDNEVQPDALLRIRPTHGGQSTTDSDGYVAGAPELIVEVSASTASYDLHEKLRAYRRNGVLEYVVWRVLDEDLDWFVLDGGRYVRALPDAGGPYRSRAFPGLWLDAQALLSRDLATVPDCVEEGVRTDEHRDFAERLVRQRRAD